MGGSEAANSQIKGERLLSEVEIPAVKAPGEARC
jgi:hypothetical protein